MNRRWILAAGAAAVLAAPAARAQGLGLPPMSGTRLRLFLSAGQAPGNAPGDSGAGVPNPGVAHIHNLRLYLPGPLPGSVFGGNRGGAMGGATAKGATGSTATSRPAI